MSAEVMSRCRLARRIKAVARRLGAIRVAYFRLALVRPTPPSPGRRVFITKGGVC